MDAPELAAITDGEPEAFAEHLSACADEHPIATFYNLGRDAVLVSPCEALSRASHAHLSNFVRQGSPEQVDLMWKSVGMALERRLVEVNGRPVWCSTSGKVPVSVFNT